MIDTLETTRFYFSPMKRPAAFAAAAAAATTLLVTTASSFCADRPAPPPPLERANVLPLALDDRFQFRKVQQFLNDSQYNKPTSEPMILFQRQRANFKAVTNVDRLQRRGHYFTFFWRAAQASPITVRFEYRQENLGSYVQAREVSYDRAHGSMVTKFEVIGDDYLDDGRISAWRALLIQDGRIVGLTQSFLWE